MSSIDFHLFCLFVFFQFRSRPGALLQSFSFDHSERSEFSHREESIQTLLNSVEHTHEKKNKKQPDTPLITGNQKNELPLAPQ